MRGLSARGLAKLLEQDVDKNVELCPLHWELVEPIIEPFWKGSARHWCLAWLRDNRGSISARVLARFINDSGRLDRV